MKSQCSTLSFQSNMAWKIIERKLGRAGSVKQRLARQRDWDRTYGEGNWEIGYVLDGVFVDQETAFEKIYYQSYVEHFRNHPEDLTELIQTAKKVRNLLQINELLLTVYHQQQLADGPPLR